MKSGVLVAFLQGAPTVFQFLDPRNQMCGHR